MANIFSSSREIFVKTMEGISSSAAKVASNTKYKVTEMTLANRKHEILESLGKVSYELWQKGIVFPEEIQAKLQEISDIDEKLNELKAEHFAYLNPEVEKELKEKDVVENQDIDLENDLEKVKEVQDFPEVPEENVVEESVDEKKK